MDPAVPGHDVARGAALDQPDVGGRLLVEPAQLHPRDRRRRGGDRAAAVLGADPGVRLDPGEVGEDLLLGRGRDDHLADRARVVEDEPGSERSLAMSKALAPRSPCSSATVSSSSIPTGGGSLRLTRDELHEDRDGRLVVGAEDRLAAAAEDALVIHHLDLARCGTVSMWAQNITQCSPLPGQPRQEVPGPGFGRPGGVVLAHLEPERPQLGRDRVGDLALLPCRAADLAQSDEPLVEPLHRRG